MIPFFLIFFLCLLQVVLTDAGFRFFFPPLFLYLAAYMPTGYVFLYAGVAGVLFDALRFSSPGLITSSIILGVFGARVLSARLAMERELARVLAACGGFFLHSASYALWWFFLKGSGEIREAALLFMREIGIGYVLILAAAVGTVVYKRFM